jgi:methylated-DNA-protein-cysteine methyltransferase-like protein
VVFVALARSDSGRVLTAYGTHAVTGILGHMKLQHEAVYALVRRIPRGRVATYGQLAGLLGMPRHARHVGFALSAIPEGLDIPWHRVVNSAGNISIRLRHWQGGSDDLQRIRLEAEGIVFSAAGKIDLKQWGWVPDQTSPRARAPRRAK